MAAATGCCNHSCCGTGGLHKAIGLRCWPSPVSSVLQMNACNLLPPCLYCAPLAAADAQVYAWCMVMVSISTVVGSGGSNNRSRGMCDWNNSYGDLL